MALADEPSPPNDAPPMSGQSTAGVSPSQDCPDNAQGRNGVVSIRCTVAAERTLKDCKVLKEDPPVIGLGACALKLSKQMRLKPMTRDGSPVREGSTFQVRVRFSIDASAQVEGH
jgi:protein TonB